MRKGCFFLGKRTPDPLERAKAKLAEPQRTEEEKYGPDENDDSVELVALEFVEQTEARDVEDRYADQGSENVIGEGHLADFGESAGDRLQRAGLDDEQNDRDVAERRQASNCVGQIGGGPGVHREVVRSGPPGGDGLGGNANRKREQCHPEITLVRVAPGKYT